MGKVVVDKMLDPRELFAGINSAAPVIVAVSGGSDSMALMLLAAAWARSRNVMLQVVTVDHGLRPEAAAEAAFVASTCERLELSHVTLAWEGLKPVTAIPDAARKARYTLIEEFAEDIGAGTIITGHTADDQAETIHMRLERSNKSDNGRGLAGMARTTLLPGGTKLVRPLLKIRRKALRRYLESCSQSWLEDPSNRDESYERVRVRKLLQGDELRLNRLISLGEVMGRFRAQKAKQAAEILYSNVKIKAGPVYEFSSQGLENFSQGVIAHALQVLVALAGGQSHLVPTNKLNELVQLITGNYDAENQELNKAGNSGANVKLRKTLGRAILEGTCEGLLIYREARNLPAMLIGAGDENWWDGRFKITNHSNNGLFVGAADVQILLAEEARRKIKLEVKPRVALRSTPTLKFDAEDLYFPMAEKRSLPPRVYVKLVATAIEHFCPQWDMPLVEWTRDLELEGKSEFMGRSSD